MGDEMNKVAVRDDVTNEIVVRDPFGGETFFPASDVQGLIKAMDKQLAMRVQQEVSLGELGDAPLEAVKELRKAIEADDSSLKDFEKNLKDALLDLSGFKAVCVQIKGKSARIDPMSFRGKLAAIYKRLKAVEDATKAPEKPEKRMFVLDATPSAWKTICGAITKAGAKIGFMSPLTSAKRIEAVGKVIKAIEADEAAANAAMGAI